MIIVDILISSLFFFALPVLIIRSLNEKLKKHFSAIILVNFIIFKAILFFGTYLIGIEFIQGSGGIVWSILAYLYLKKQFAAAQEVSPVPPAESTIQNEES